MKRITLGLLAGAFLLTQPGCIKDTSCSPKTVQSEAATITSYALANSINATVHSSGVNYEIINPGSGAAPNTSSTISVTYTGKLLDGTIFDSRTTPIQISLSNAIEGWKIAIPLLQEGGVMKMIIPSSLAYGCVGAGSGVIPPDAIIYFEVTLVDVL
jgi:FKBP-type peptidyl-prolyl cis-trans isomerase FkpA